MTVVFLVPDIHDLPTGGNVYNRRLLAHLDASVDVVAWPVDTAPADASLAAATVDVIVVDSLLVRHDAALGRLRTARPEARFVLLAHGLACLDPARRNTETAQTERARLDGFDGAVTTSAFARSALVDLGMPADAVYAVPPGLDDAYRAPVPNRPASERPHVLTVASLVPGKGLLELVDVFERLDAVPWTAEIVGNDALNPSFARQVRTRLQNTSVANRVTLTGAVNEEAMPAVYDRADVFALPSRFETCSMATREAMARGLPVVAYAVGGLPGNLGDAPAGRLVDAGDVDAFTQALRSLLTDADRRRRMGRAARIRSADFPTWSDAARRFGEWIAGCEATK